MSGQQLGQSVSLPELRARTLRFEEQHRYPDARFLLARRREAEKPGRTRKQLRSDAAIDSLPALPPRTRTGRFSVVLPFTLRNVIQKE